MKRSAFLPILFLLISCTLPAQTPVPTPAIVVSPTPTEETQPTAALGSKENPLILLLGADPRPTTDFIAAGETLAARLQALTNYHFVTVAPTSEADIIKAFELGNAHIASLSPFAYFKAYNNGDVHAALASIRNGSVFYGAQFIARRQDEYKVYFDPARNDNTANADVALQQFEDKKPCWSDTASPSAYVIPLGLLKHAKVETRSGAFVEGQITVVRAIYSGGICDFGATYVDARTHPSLESAYPDVMKEVEVIWRTPKIIPYEMIAFSSDVPIDVERSLLRAFVDLMTKNEDKVLIQTVYGIDVLQIVQDAVYEDFRTYTKDSEIDPASLVK